MQLLKRRPEKNPGFNENRTHDLCVAGAMLYQLSYEATYAGELVNLLSSLNLLKLHCKQ